MSPLHTNWNVPDFNCEIKSKPKVHEKDTTCIFKRDGYFSSLVHPCLSVMVWSPVIQSCWSHGVPSECAASGKAKLAAPDWVCLSSLSSSPLLSSPYSFHSSLLLLWREQSEGKFVGLNTGLWGKPAYFPLILRVFFLLRGKKKINIDVGHSTLKVIQTSQYFHVAASSLLFFSEVIEARGKSRDRNTFASPPPRLCVWVVSSVKLFGWIHYIYPK